MRAIEIKSKTDNKGVLKLNYRLSKSNKKVRVLIFVEDEKTEIDEEHEWIKSISSNPAFAYLNDESENVYTLNDGEPFVD